MIIIPEIESILILVPRTGSHSLKHAVAEKYPRSFLLYRHMEADGVPAGFDRYKKIGVVRHPVDRLWSLYNYLKIFGGKSRLPGEWEDRYVEIQRRSVDRCFSEWITDNEIVFTSPYSRDKPEWFQPYFTVKHCLPENRKSQFIYLRPDLGTKIFGFNDIRNLHSHLGVRPKVSNHAPRQTIPELSEAAQLHIQDHFSWDMIAFGETIRPAPEEWR